MGSFSAYLGKGLSEPCSPFRQANVFGAVLNTPDASGWNCPPNIVGSATTFNLSGIPDNREVCVALAKVTNAEEGTYSIRFTFYKETPYKKLFDYTFSIEAIPGGWLYAYAFIGRVSWEINENGAYFVSIGVGGPESFSQEIKFTVAGMPVVVTPAPVPTNFMGDIIAALNAASSFTYSIYLEVNGWIWPFNLVSGPFYWLSVNFNNLAWGFYHFWDWVNDISARIGGALSWDTVWNFIISRFPQIEQLRDWFYNWWNNVTGAVTSWWSATSVTVQGWIQEAKQYAASLVSSITAGLLTLQGAWDGFKVRIPTIDGVIYWWSNWTGNVLTAVNSWWTGKLTEVQGLINSAFTARASFWEGWQDMRDNVLEFFADPVEYIWGRFADWFLGPEE